MASIVSVLTALQTRRQAGQAMVEYGLILGLVSVVAVSVKKINGTDIDGVYTAVPATLSAVPGA